MHFLMNEMGLSQSEYLTVLHKATTGIDVWAINE
jgi:hypothetical protein